MPLTDLSPAGAAHVQSVIEERLAALSARQGLKETVTIEWRGQQVAIETISMPLELLYYNPMTHRVRAQRTLDTERDREPTKRHRVQGITVVIENQHCSKQRQGNGAEGNQRRAPVTQEQ